MKITQSSLIQHSRHVEHQLTDTKKDLRIWIGDRRPDFNQAAVPGEENPNQDTVSISQKALQLFLSTNNTLPSTTSAQTTDDQIAEDPKMQTLRLIIEAMTGRKIKVAKFTLHTEPPDLQHHKGSSTDGGQERVGWGVEYDSTETYEEAEQTSFESRGTILTQDGKEINFNIQFSLSREYIETNEVHIRLGDAKLVDPLVINFEGTAAQLKQETYRFDLDNDGIDEELNQLGAGSGFLFIDKNGDGKATNGTELFGPQTGNGFEELAELDSDGNGWIDENDSSFDTLQIWQKEPDGSDSSTKLSVVGIGALSLTPIETQFSLKSSANNHYGTIQETAVFLKEDGQVGTVQELYLAV